MRFHSGTKSLFFIDSHIHRIHLVKLLPRIVTVYTCATAVLRKPRYRKLFSTILMVYHYVSHIDPKEPRAITNLSIFFILSFFISHYNIFHNLNMLNLQIAMHRQKNFYCTHLKWTDGTFIWIPNINWRWKQKEKT